MSTSRDELNIATRAVAAGRPLPRPGAPLNPPVVLSSTFRAGGDAVYAREGLPTWAALEEAVGALESGSAVAFASGMAAVAAILERLPPGTLVVAPSGAYHGTRALLRRLASSERLDVRLIDVADTAAALAACAPGALLWVESPTNPMLDVADLPALIGGAHDLGAVVCVDNTFATPVLQRPLELGADLVVHSATKYLAGHSDLLMGAAVAADPAVAAELVDLRTTFGSVPGPLEAYLALRGLRTLHLRVERAQANAAKLARRLASHPGVRRVRYPGLEGDPGRDRAQRFMDGFGAMVSFEVADAATADRLTASLRLIADATSLGGVESTIDRRSKYAGEEGVPPGLLRLSVGCEHVEDLWADLEEALTAATQRP